MRPQTKLTARSLEVWSCDAILGHVCVWLLIIRSYTTIRLSMQPLETWSSTFIRLRNIIRTILLHGRQSQNRDRGAIFMIVLNEIYVKSGTMRPKIKNRISTGSLMLNEVSCGILSMIIARSSQVGIVIIMLHLHYDILVMYEMFLEPLRAFILESPFIPHPRNLNKLTYLA